MRRQMIDSLDIMFRSDILAERPVLGLYCLDYQTRLQRFSAEVKCCEMLNVFNNHQSKVKHEILYFVLIYKNFTWSNVFSCTLISFNKRFSDRYCMPADASLVQFEVFINPFQVTLGNYLNLSILVYLLPVLSAKCCICIQCDVY